MTEVRRAEATDGAAVAVLVQEAHAFHAAALPDVFQPPAATVVTAADIAHLVTQPAQLLFVAVLGGAVVGYAHAEVQETPATPYKRASAVLHLHAMRVGVAHRGRGAGRALLQAVRAAAAARGPGAATLAV